MPPNRTSEFAIWRACERFRVRPPGVSETWDNSSSVAQAQMIAFDQLREYDEIEIQKKLAGCK